MGKREQSNSHYQRAAIEAVLAGGFIPDGETRTESYRAKVGELAQALVTAGGRQRFAKPGTPMKVTVGRITVCFYEVEKGKEPKNYINISTRQIDRITHWAKSEICYMRRDADAMGREVEWLERNPHLIEAANAAGAIAKATT